MHDSAPLSMCGSYRGHSAKAMLSDASSALVFNELFMAVCFHS